MWAAVDGTALSPLDREYKRHRAAVCLQGGEAVPTSAMAEIFDQPMRANAAVLQRAGAGRLFIAREMTLEHRGTIAVPLRRRWSHAYGDAIARPNQIDRDSSFE